MIPTNDEISEIYKFCLSKAIDRIGWIFSYNFNIHVQQHKSIKEMIMLIRQEMFNTFDDDCPYNLEDWNQAFAGYSEYIQGNERSKFGIYNDNEGLLLIVALILEILSGR